MTIDERIEKLEFLLAGHIEQANKDYAENRRLWRDQQTDIAAIWKRMERGFEETKARFQELAEERRENERRWVEERRASAKESAIREQRLDERIDKLVTAIGELCRRLDGGTR